MRFLHNVVCGGHGCPRGFGGIVYALTTCYNNDQTVSGVDDGLCFVRANYNFHKKVDEVEAKVTSAANNVKTSFKTFLRSNDTGRRLQIHDLQKRFLRMQPHRSFLGLSIFCEINN